MAITTTTNRVQFDGDDSTTAFAFTFPITVTSELKVYLDDTLQTETTDYTLSATNNDYSGGGTCTFNTAPATGETVTLERIIPSTSTLDLTSGDTLPAESIEDAIDRLTMQFQQLEDKLSRAITIPNTDPTTLDMELVAQASRTSGQGIMFDNDGQPTVGSFSGSTISAFMSTVTDDTDADEAQATLTPDVAAVSTSPYTITDTGPSTLMVTSGSGSDLSINLPTAADNNGRRITIIKVDSGSANVTINGEGSETIDGALAVYLYTQYARAHMVCDGTGWYLLDDLVANYAMGTWDMDADPQLIITHGLTDFLQIKAVHAMVISDAENTITVFEQIDTTETAAMVIGCTSTQIQLTRATGGPFDAATYATTPAGGRGYVRVIYGPGG